MPETIRGYDNWKLDNGPHEDCSARVRRCYYDACPRSDSCEYFADDPIDAHDREDTDD